MADQPIIVYATQWCSDCRRAKRFFEQQQIACQWIDIDHDPVAEQKVIQLNRGMRSVPTIICADGSVLVEPSDQQLAQKFCAAQKFEKM